MIAELLFDLIASSAQKRILPAAVFIVLLVAGVWQLIDGESATTLLLAGGFAAIWLSIEGLLVAGRYVLRQRRSERDPHPAATTTDETERD